MRPALLAAALVGLALAGSLQGCGKYGLKGDRGLPPPREDLPYPNVNQAPSGANIRALKSPSEQARIRAELDARKRQR